MVQQERNPGMPLDMGLINAIVVNKSATVRRCGELGTRRIVTGDHQLAWLMRAISCMDLTTLKGNDTPMRVFRLCEKAKMPVRQDMIKKLGKSDLTAAAVCVYPARVKDAVRALKGTGIPVASVATGFPSGQTSLKVKLEEIRQAVVDGAEEIDVVISRDKVALAQWTELYDEIRAFREACGAASLKVIMAAGELPTLTHLAKASMIAMMAGADFIKTSTGMEEVNATFPIGMTMVRQIREYYELTGHMVGFKAAGGINDAATALVWLSLIREELGVEWLNSNYFRIGASSLINDIERSLWVGLTGMCAARTYMPLA
ncbi:DeoC/FbaB/ lacD aldolase [Carpediemonas membranifera]|uniref:deoxyribose-phosphate aldolase n=1 Tax=Carpediemonas membranifera TaxID=201153 RepID=A0A8J6EBE7_9EUKA|nr:DeoC/FbaB/ lacD aldolase [Carpediemonas membranifera]|eukprot:KAG9397000.1 DeoC/FbaB/ lacD aldolase [Carpediemonas membranifera]